MEKRRLGICVTCSLLILALLTGGCSKKDTAGTIVIHDGQYTEMHIIHRMVKLLVEANTDLAVDIRDEMSHLNSYNELLRGNSDLMNSYDGTVLTTYLGMDPTDIPEGEKLYDYVNGQLSEKGLRLLDKLGMNNTYAVAVPRKLAEEYGLETVSDLAEVSENLVFGAEHDFFIQAKSGKYDAMTKFYSMTFKDIKQLDISLKYSAVESGNIDVTVVYTTDGLNRKADLKVLQDDLGFFPEYYGALMVREDLFTRNAGTAPQLEALLNELGGIISDVDMVNMTYAVDVDGKNVEEVTRAFLQQKGILN